VSAGVHAVAFPGFYHGSRHLNRRARAGA
jgi:hypothetical protein